MTIRPALSAAADAYDTGMSALEASASSHTVASYNRELRKLKSAWNAALEADMLLDNADQYTSLVSAPVLEASDVWSMCEATGNYVWDELTQLDLPMVYVQA